MSSSEHDITNNQNKIYTYYIFLQEKLDCLSTDITNMTNLSQGKVNIIIQLNMYCSYHIISNKYTYQIKKLQKLHIYLIKLFLSYFVISTTDSMSFLVQCTTIHQYKIYIQHMYLQYYYLFILTYTYIQDFDLSTDEKTLISSSHDKVNITIQLNIYKNIYKMKTITKNTYILNTITPMISCQLYLIIGKI